MKTGLSTLTSLVALCLLLLSGGAQASLICYEGFTNYAAGNLAGQNGGSGWSGPWASNTCP